MLIQTQIQDANPELLQLLGNELLLLQDSDSIYFIQSGKVALFAVASQGKRRYLYSLTAGEAMFGRSPISPTPQHLIAVSLEATELIKIPRSSLLQTHPAEAIVWMETWVNCLGSILSDLTPPSSPTPPEGTHYCSLMPNDIFQPESVVWLRLQQGHATWMGREEFPLTPDDVIPLSADLWLQAVEQIDFEQFDPSERTDDNTLFRGLDLLHTQILHLLDQLDQQNIQQELLRFQEQAQIDQQVVAETLGELISVLPSSAQRVPPPVSQTGDPLLVAMGAVGRSLGIQIHPAAKSESSHRRSNPLFAIARASQVRLRRVSLPPNWWQKDIGALLAYRKDDQQPVAILPVSSTRMVIFDPKTHTTTAADAQTALQLESSAYTFYRSLPTDLTRSRLFQFALRGHFKELLTIGGTGILVTLLGMITPQATGILLDQAIPNADRGLVLQMGFGLLAAAFGSAMFQLVQGITLLRLETFADTSIQAAVWDRLLKLKPSFFRQYAVGDLSSRVSTISYIHKKLSSTLLKSTFSSLFSLLNLGLLFYYNTQLAWLAVGVAIVNVVLTVCTSLVTLQRFRQLLNLQGKLFGIVVQLVNGVVKLRVSGSESRAFALWGKQYSQQLKITLMTQGMEDLLAVVNKLLPALTTAALFWFTVPILAQAQSGESSFSIGTFLAFNTAFGTFISSVTSLSNTAIEVLQILPLWKRAEPILQATPEVDANKTDPGRLSGRVLVHQVEFRYRPEGALTLQNVTIEAKPGEFIALVGPSGSGKSTLLRLLLGFDTPETGGIFYDGQDLAGLDVHAVRRQFGVVLQNSRLLSASILENIASGASITLEEAWEAARMAGFAEDIEAMPMGMHTLVSEGGTNLSGGQRQRLLIARSLALKPKLLLFDEATSALDNRTQEMVSESLERLRVTRIVIAHRLSTIRNADRIYVLDAGCIVQQGSFTQLSQQEGLFAQLIARQTV